MAQHGPAHNELITVETPHLDSSIYIILHIFTRYNLATIITSDITSIPVGLMHITIRGQVC